MDFKKEAQIDSTVYSNVEMSDIINKKVIDISSDTNSICK